MPVRTALLTSAGILLPQLTTNFGRTHVFGGYHDPGQNVAGGDVPRWTPLVPQSPARIAGLFVDCIYHQRLPCVADTMANVGVSYLPEQEAPEPSVVGNLPLSPQPPGCDRAVLSTASIHNVKAVRKRAMNFGGMDRCGGLHMEYHDGGVAVLGRWDPMTPGYVGTVWEAYSGDGPLRGLAFLIRRPRGGSAYQVLDVRPMTDKTEPAEYRDALSVDAEEEVNWRWFLLSSCEVSMARPSLRKM